MLEVAHTIVLGALLREESRGAHFRRDFDTRNDTNWLKHTIAKMGNDLEPVISYKDVVITRYQPMERKYWLRAILIHSRFYVMTSKSRIKNRSLNLINQSHSRSHRSGDAFAHSWRNWRNFIFPLFLPFSHLRLVRDGHQWKIDLACRTQVATFGTDTIILEPLPNSRLSKTSSLIWPFLADVWKDTTVSHTKEPRSRKRNSPKRKR